MSPSASVGLQLVVLKPALRWLHSTITVSLVGSRVDAAALVRLAMSNGSEDTAPLRAPSRAAFAVLFHEWKANPKSMMPKTNMKKSVATIANSTAAAPSSRPALPRRDGRTSGSCGPLTSGSAEVTSPCLRCELFIGPLRVGGTPAATLGFEGSGGYSAFPGEPLRTSTYVEVGGHPPAVALVAHGPPLSGYPRCASLAVTNKEERR